MMTFDLRHLFPRFILQDRNGYALCKAIGVGLECFVETVALGTAIIDDASAMPEWRLDEVAWELSLPYNYKADIEQKRTWVAEALGKEQRFGTKDAVLRLLNGLFGAADVEEGWEYGGDPYHYRITIKSDEWTDEQTALLTESLGKAANVRSILDEEMAIGADALVRIRREVLEGRIYYPMLGALHAGVYPDGDPASWQEVSSPRGQIIYTECGTTECGA